MPVAKDGNSSIKNARVKVEEVRLGLKVVVVEKQLLSLSKGNYRLIRLPCTVIKLLSNDEVLLKLGYSAPFGRDIIAKLDKIRRSK